MTDERPSVLAVWLAGSLLVCGLALAVCFGPRDDHTRTDAATTPAPGVLGQDVAAVAAGPAVSVARLRLRVLEMESSGDASGVTTHPSRDPIPGKDRDPVLHGELPRGSARVVFVVEDASGRALPAVSVLLESLEPGAGAERVETRADGEARFFDLASGSYAYLAQARGGSTRASDALRLEPGEHKHLTVRLLASGLSIAGRVRNEQGEPVAGLKIAAARHHFASAVSEVASRGTGPRSGRTDAGGAFVIGGLEEGEHDVVTDATHRYPSAKLVIQAGATSVDLIVKEGRRVQGSVTSPNGEPLGRVWVGLDPGRKHYAYTDAAGGYELWLDPVSEDPGRSIRFYLRGYEEERVALRDHGVDGLPLHVELRPVENVAAVAGVVESERGQPIAGATIVLASRELGTRYQTVSDMEGAFSIPDAKVGRGYSLSVIPRGPYQDHVRNGLHVRETGLSLDVLLESLNRGRLFGRMLDAEGGELAGFRIWVVSNASTRSALPVSGDERGYFELAEAPAGSLSFDTRVSPHLRVVGVTLPADGERNVALVLDWGEEELFGQVVGERGEPIPGAEVSLSWSHTNGDIHSTSQRETRTNPSGSFRFNQLGPGEHRLDVRAAGYRASRERHDVGRHATEVEIRLEADEH